MAKVVGGIAVKVGADISSLQRSMGKAGKSVRGFGNDFDKTSKRMSAKALKVASSFALIASAAAGIASAAKFVADNSRELQNLSQVAGVSVERFQSLSFAAKEFGIEQDKLSDILKDVNDKMGDFTATGAGPMKDFFEKIGPLVGVTADQFRGLSSADALGLYVSSLEKANVSQAEMTFFMEALASDASKLAPLLVNDAAALGQLEQAARDMGVVIDEDLIAKTARMGEIWDRMLNVMQSRFISFAAVTMGGFDAIFGITEGAQLEIENRKLSGLADDRIDILQRIRTQEEKIARFRKRFPDRPIPETQRSKDIEHLNTVLVATEEEMNIVNNAMLRIQKQIGIREEAKARLEALSNNAGLGGGAGGGGRGGSSKAGNDFEALRAQFATEFEIIGEEFANQLAQLEEFRASKLGTEEEYNELEARIRKDHADRLAALDQASIAAKLQMASGMFGDLATIFGNSNKKLFKIGQVAAIASATIDGLEAAVSAFKHGMAIGGPAMAYTYQAASLLKTGAMISQIASQGATGGGGGGSVGGGAVSPLSRGFITMYRCKAKVRYRVGKSGG